MRWRFRTRSWVDAAPAVVDGTVYIGSQDANLYALDEKTGRRRWSYEVGGGITGEAVVIDGIAYVSSLDHNLYAIDTLSRTTMWTFETGDRLWSGPVVADGVVYVGSKDASVYAVDAATGGLVWQYDTGDSIIGGVRLHGDMLLFPSYDYSLYALDVSDGTLLWRAAMGSGSATRPGVGDGAVYVGDFDGRVYAFDVETGRSLWTQWLGETDIWASPVVHGDLVLVGASDGRLYALADDDGSLRWSFATEGEIGSTPAISDGTVYFGSYDDGIYAVDIATGGLAWRFATEGDIGAAVAVLNGTVYAGSRDGALYAIAAGIPPGTELKMSATLVASSTPDFIPLSPEEARDLVEESRRWKALGGTRSTADGGVERISTIDEVFQLYELAHFLLTGVPSRWIPLVFPREEFQHLTRDPELARAAAWCCRRTEDGNLELIIKGSEPAQSVVGFIGHEAGHARQMSRNPGQRGPRDSNVGALHEAQAFAFEAAVIRKLGEYTGVNAAIIPSQHNVVQRISNWMSKLQGDLHDVTEQHQRGSALLWSAVLNDPALADLRSELERNGLLAADSLLLLHDHLVGIERDEADDYVAGLLEVFDPTLVKETVLRRSGAAEDGFFEHVWDIFLMP